MGYKVIMNQGHPELTWEQETTILTDMVLSILVPRGAFFHDPNFGLPELPKKLTPENIPLVRQRFQEALQWLINTGKAKSIDIIAEQDEDWPNRVNIAARAVQSNDQLVTYETFVEVL